MNFKKNIIPLGSSSVSAIRGDGDSIRFFMASDGIIASKSFDLAKHRITSLKGVAAYAAAFVPLALGSVLDVGELIYEKN